MAQQTSNRYSISNQVLLNILSYRQYLPIKKLQLSVKSHAGSCDEKYKIYQVVFVLVMVCGKWHPSYCKRKLNAVVMGWHISTLPILLLVVFTYH
jgi:hypothetical protein